MKKVIPYATQEVTDEDIKAVEKVLRSDFLTQGPLADKFEQDMCAYIGSKYGVALSNGTAALHLAAMALGVQKGDKVLVVTNSFVSSANCVKFCGGEVEFVDIDKETFCISVDHLREKLESSPENTYKGIIGVDFAGQSADFEAISILAKKYNLWVIEDSCHAIGSTFVDSKGVLQKAGNCSYADISIFSFHAVKHIATGEGGMITTNNEVIYKKLKSIRTHGITKNPNEFQKNDGGWYYEMQSLGFNYRIPEILCALGVSQLSRIDSNLGKRRKIAKVYNSELDGLPITPQLGKLENHAFHLYVINTEKRDELYNFLNSKNIRAQVHYIPIHTQPYYIESQGKVSLPNAENYYQKTLSLPMYHSLNESDLSFVIDSLKEFYKK